MNKKIFFMLLFSPAFLLMLNADNPADILWQKAEKIAFENWNLVPGRIHKEKKVYKKNGKLKSTKEVILESNYEDNKISLHFVQARTDKKELTEENSYVLAEMNKDYYPQNNSIFHNAEKFKVKYYRTNETLIIRGRKCAIYDIEFQQVEDGKIVEYLGKVFLDAKNGTPYRLEKTAKKLPAMMKSFLETTEYEIDNNGNWITKSELTATKAKLLLLTITMHLKYTYSDYWKFPGK
ncbi:MAG: hypothetical protein HQ534_01305 [Armatimonadetes bacterium]|nr:hypothetical protein [Armatimonadota bacterium]